MRLKILGLLGFSVLLAGCLPELTGEQSAYERDETRASLSQNYSRTLLNYASKAEATLLENQQWQNISQGRINFAQLGATMGTSENYVEAALCRDNDKGLLLTWFDTRTRDNKVALKGMGGAGGTRIMQSVTEMVDSSSLAIMSNEGLRYLEDKEFVALPGSGCAGLDIPFHTPVILTEMIKPVEIERLADVSTVEYQKMACADPNQTGYRIFNRTVTFSGSSQSHSDWDLVQDACYDVVENVQIDTVENVMEDEALDGATLSMLQTSGAMGQTIRGALKNVECLDQEQGGQSKDGTACARAANMTSLNLMDQLRGDSALDASERYTTECGGSSGTGTVAEYSSPMTYTAWAGQAMFERDLQAYYTDSQLGDTGNDDLTYKRGDWVGLSISCQRTEKTQVSCDSLKPSGIPSDVTLANNGSYHLTRSAHINGWADKVAKTPANPTHSPWEVESVNCTWQQAETMTPSCPCGVANNGQAIRRYSSEETLGSFSTSWDVVDSGTCKPCDNGLVVAYLPPAGGSESSSTSGNGAGGSAASSTSGSLEFAIDPGEYLALNSDVAAAARMAVDRGEIGSVEDFAWNHFVEFGVGEGRKTSVDNDEMLRKHPELQGKFGPGTLYDNIAEYVTIHGTASQKNSLGNSGVGKEAIVFNEAYYLAANPDVAKAVANGDFTSGLDHFSKFGRNENRATAQGAKVQANYVTFNEKDYLASNPDVAAAVARGDFTSGLDHFAKFGHQETRRVSQSSPAKNVGTTFDSAFYLRNNPDVAAAVASGAFTSALDHYIKHGSSEGRAIANVRTSSNSSRSSSSGHSNTANVAAQQKGSGTWGGFDEKAYLQKNPDVAAAVASGHFSSGAQHFKNHGIHEGRSAATSKAFNASSYLAANPDVAAAVARGETTAAQHMKDFGLKEGRKW